MKLTFKTAPLSLNHTKELVYNGRRTSFKNTAEYNALIFIVAQTLKSSYNRSSVQAWAKSYDEMKHAITANYVFYMPNLFCKKKRKINKKSRDCSNIVKPLEDCIFRPLALINPQIDDAQVISLSSRKVEHHEYRIEVELSIVNF